MKKYNFNPKKLFDIMNTKKVFLLQIFTNLIFQILVTFVIFYNIKIDIINNNNISLIFLVLLQFGIIFIFSFFEIPIFFKFLLMTLFSSIWGLILIGLKKHVSPEVVKTAIFGALGIFICIFIFGLLLVAFGVYLDYRFGFLLLGLLLLLIITTIVLRLMNKYNGVHKGIAIISIILFSLFIIYDTNNILYNDTKDVIGASMDYYLDIMNIFINIVNYQS
jgi:FtsH-binding integral membrane protein